MIGLLLAVNLILNVVMNPQGTAVVTLKVPGQVQGAQVIVFPVKAPEYTIPLKQGYNGKTDKWVFRCKIPRYNNVNWAAVASVRGKVAFAIFKPNTTQKITMTVVDLPAPTVSGTAGNYTVAAPAPSAISAYVKKTVIMVNRTAYVGSATVTALPVVAYAKYYYTGGNDKWVVSDYYLSE